jgi:hypothetical protein
MKWLVRKHAKRLPLDVFVCLLVIGGHVLILLVLSRPGSSLVRRVPEEIVSVALSIVPTDRTRRDETNAAPKETPGGISTRQFIAPERARSPVAEAEEALSEQPIDWNAAAERSARRASVSTGEPGARVFGVTPESPYRPCEKKESSFKWDPEPKKAGFAGGLPYVTVGERCVIGLGFFGCSLGELPPANGTLLDDMNAADQPQGSVPGPEDCLKPAR